jgi:hypothetical protein
MQMIVGGFVLSLVAAIAFTAYIWLLGVSTPARVSTYAYINPAVAVLIILSAVALVSVRGGDPRRPSVLSGDTR